MTIDCVNVRAGDLAKPVYVVVCVEWTELPLRFFVEWAEQIHFHDDGASARIGNEIAEALEVSIVPTLQVEFVPTSRITGLIGPSPWGDEAARGGCEGVARDVERALRLDISATRECARVVQFLPGQGVEILPIIKIEVEHRAIVLAGSDQDHRLAAPEEIMGVVRVQTNRLSRRAAAHQRQQAENTRGQRESAHRKVGHQKN